MTGAELLAKITGRCDELGLRWYHPSDSRRDQPGWPDLVIGSAHGVIFAEVKGRGDQVSPEQWEWATFLIGAGNKWFVWRPDGWLNGSIQNHLDDLAEA